MMIQSNKRFKKKEFECCWDFLGGITKHFKLFLTDLSTILVDWQFSHFVAVIDLFDPVFFK
jgi:hypothetical protein